MSYAAPSDAAAPRIRDLAGNAAASFSGQAAVNNTPPPFICGNLTFREPSAVPQNPARSTNTNHNKRSTMTKPTIMPIGIIKQSTGDGTIFVLIRPGNHSILKINSPVTVRNTHWNQDEIPSGVMVRGHVTEIGPTIATFKVAESKMGPHWPKDADTLAPGSFVHLLLPDSFDMDRSQIAT